MPEEIPKQEPIGIPPATGIRLEVLGGHPDERYEFRFEADASGEFTASLVDRIRKVEKNVRFAKMAQSDIAFILNSLDMRRMALATRAAKPIPPGSVVGRLTVGDGREEMSVVFMADRRQAKVAGVRRDPALEKVVDRIYRVAARHLKVKDVRP